MSPLLLNRVPSAALRLAEVRPVAQQQVRGAEGAGGQHEPVAGDDPGRLGVGVDRGVRVLQVALDVVDFVAAGWPRADGLDLVAGAQVGAVVLGGGQIVVVQGVLGAVVAADVAFAAQAAGGARAAVQVAVVRVHDRQPDARRGARSWARS